MPPNPNQVPEVPEHNSKASSTARGLTAVIGALVVSACTATGPKEKHPHRPVAQKLIPPSVEKAPITITHLASDAEQIMAQDIQKRIEEDAEYFDLQNIMKLFGTLYHEKNGVNPENLTIKLVKPFVTDKGVAYIALRYRHHGQPKTTYLCTITDTLQVPPSLSPLEGATIEFDPEGFINFFVDYVRKNYGQVFGFLVRCKVRELIKAGLSGKELYETIVVYLGSSEISLDAFGFYVNNTSLVGKRINVVLGDRVTGSDQEFPIILDGNYHQGWIEVSK